MQCLMQINEVSNHTIIRLNEQIKTTEAEIYRLHNLGNN